MRSWVWRLYKDILVNHDLLFSHILLKNIYKRYTIKARDQASDKFILKQ